MYRLGGDQSQRGHSLIELVIIIVILGALAAVALPQYRDMTVESRISACKNSLGAIREGISLYYARQVLVADSGSYPSLDSLTASDLVMRGAFPPNPFQAQAADSVVLGTVRGQVIGTRGGWAYNPITGEIWPNSSTTIPEGWMSPAREINENEF
ncbi:hypothetical protein GF420_04135 [candidate division GN15 bacterium]|nr:hypothetical protein [candidate division GN15 bacterium]